MKITIEQIYERLHNRFPEAEFEILEYNGINNPFSIKCLHCNTIMKNKHCGTFLRKQNFCQCSAKKRTIARIDECEQICNQKQNLQYVSKYFRETSRKWAIIVRCLQCNQTFEKDVQSFLIKPSCPWCANSHNIINTISFQKILPDEYTLISEYHGTENKILIRHKCGFIWSIRPHVLIGKINQGYTGCPHCNHKHSQGEKKINKYLTEHNITFMQERIFPWSSNSKFRYDFFLPDYNLIIEYMGQQHYREVSFYHDTLEERQEHDKIKEQEARQQGYDYLIISYVDFKNIETILKDWFNDYSARK